MSTHINSERPVRFIPSENREFYTTEDGNFGIMSQPHGWTVFAVDASITPMHAACITTACGLVRRLMSNKMQAVRQTSPHMNVDAV